MADNSWIQSDRLADNSYHILRLKVILTILVVIVGAFTVIIAHGIGSNNTQYQSEGIVIDFGNYRTVWTDISFTETDSPIELLNQACEDNFATTPVFIDGKLTAIDDGIEIIENTSDTTWNLWFVKKNTFDYVKADTYDIKASDYTVVVWAYTKENALPAIAVDATGTSIYGYSQPHSVVTLSPVSTELIGAMDAANMIVGTDYSSNYPKSVIKVKENGGVVGTYTDPSYEAIMHASPDMVFCDASAYSHITMASTLRNSNLNVVVIYDGKDLKTVLDNIFIVGTAMRYEQRATYVAEQVDIALNKILDAVGSRTSEKTLITLSATPSPFVAGTETYVNDILHTLNGMNAVEDSHWPSQTPNTSWPNISPAMIMELNPSCIIIFDYGEFSPEEYELMLASLSDEWKATDAYTSGNVYLFSDDLGEMAQRSGPRVAQLTEIIARIICPDAFTDGITIPHAIGNNYQDYLTYTKNLGFGD